MGQSATSNTSSSSSSHVAMELQQAMATPAELKVLKRIDAQRERLHARRLAVAQAKALKADSADRINAEAPLTVRLLTFAKLHPVVVAATLGVALFTGPARLFRVASFVLPIVMRMRK